LHIVILNGLQMIFQEINNFIVGHVLS